MTGSPGELLLGGAARRGSRGSSGAAASTAWLGPNASRLGEKALLVGGTPTAGSRRRALMIGAIALVCMVGLLGSLFASQSAAPYHRGLSGATSLSNSSRQPHAPELQQHELMSKLSRAADDAAEAAAAAAAAAHNPPVACTSGVVPHQQQPGQRPLLVAPEPPINITLLIEAAAAANDTRLERIGKLLQQHRMLTAAGSSMGGKTGSSSSSSMQAADPRNVTAARAAYARAIDAALRESAFASLGGNTAAAAAAGSAAREVRASDGTRTAEPEDGDEGSEAEGGAATALAAAMIAEALEAIQDYGTAVAAARGGEPVLVPCAATADPTLPATLRPGQRVLIAANLRNSEAVMPNFLVQTLRLAVAQPAAPEGAESSVFVAVYESGSRDDDATGAAWCLCFGVGVGVGWKGESC